MLKIFLFFCIIFINPLISEVNPYLFEDNEESIEHVEDEELKTEENDNNKNEEVLEGDDKILKEENIEIKKDTIKNVNLPQRAKIPNVQSRQAISRVLPSYSASNGLQRNVARRNINSSRQSISDRNLRYQSRQFNSNNNISNTNNRRVVQQRVNIARSGSKPLYIGRVSTRASNFGAGIRSSSRTSVSQEQDNQKVPENVSETVSKFDKINQMTDFCKTQYMGCMDNFCNVLDENQGRCSCSPNVLSYAETEENLKKVKEELQEVSMKIRYVGLSKQEVETLFKQTEAEIAMQGKTDDSDIKKQLDSVKNLILDVKNIKPETLEDNDEDVSGLLNLNFDDSEFDLNSIFGKKDKKENIFSNKKGQDLYNIAYDNCEKNVVSSCKRQGVDIDTLIYGYKFEIDKQCVAYEKNLNEASLKMRRTVRNAKNILQKARLLVSQQKNTYNLKECVGALDKCMQDEFVCGNNYKNCLDPTGKYIVNGSVVVGSKLGEIRQKGKNVWSDYDNFDTEKETTSVVGKKLTELIAKEGAVTTKGVCYHVLDKCQNYTYDNEGKYNKSNEVVDKYLQMTLLKIKGFQDEIVSRYANSCMNDVETCLRDNKSNVDKNSTEKAKQACQFKAITCASINGGDDNFKEKKNDKIIIHDKPISSWWSDNFGTLIKI